MSKRQLQESEKIKIFYKNKITKLTINIKI